MSKYTLGVSCVPFASPRRQSSLARASTFASSSPRQRDRIRPRASPRARARTSLAGPSGGSYATGCFAIAATSSALMELALAPMSRVVSVCRRAVDVRRRGGEARVRERAPGPGAVRERRV
jgi:hypothetical protein